MTSVDIGKMDGEQLEETRKAAKTMLSYCSLESSLIDIKSFIAKIDARLAEIGAPEGWTVVVMEEIVGKGRFDITIKGQQSGYKKGFCEENVTWRIVGESPKRMLEYNFTY